MMRLAGVDYAISEGSGRRPLLSGMDLTFAAGAFTCLTGASGTGKTTILSLLAGVCLPDAGLVLDGDTPLSAMREAARTAWRRAHVGMVFQTCRLIDVLTAAEHMALVARLRGHAEAEENGLALLDRLGLADKKNSRPGQLSGGEKQRVALAQALASRPRIVLADEPTAALDRTNAEFVAQTLRDYARQSGAVVVAVSHDDAMIQNAHARTMLTK
ncbi:ATP-binding cassette domain-containing protein [Sandarakinorhabdus sp.]|uniref:ABC transporter ATP-binding protein n=1 Tax=Sandarakinorhabdus sp. TaxID=1916663 RepID=UPI00286DB868|nr:ATP-binding cassette domain-containing protein [Sandarakinorhabdus sp.]